MRRAGLIGIFLFGLSTVSLADERALNVGVQVLAVDGTPVGHVAGLSRDVKGHIYRISIATSSPLGLGERMITVRGDAFYMKADAVQLRLAVPELNALPTIMSQDGEREHAK